jgi:hypothetical protein
MRQHSSSVNLRVLVSKQMRLGTAACTMNRTVPKRSSLAGYKKLLSLKAANENHMEGGRLKLCVAVLKPNCDDKKSNRDAD